MIYPRSLSFANKKRCDMRVVFSDLSQSLAVQTGATRGKATVLVKAVDLRNLPILKIKKSVQLVFLR
jgi:hypothetical protein